MVKCYLSHSSKDKTSYVKIVANKLGSQNCVYDDYTFEEGMPPIGEIIKGLTSSQLFVLFLSDSALNSDWVKLEIHKAKEFFDSGNLRKIYPIIIDTNIDHKDPRIPDWMREEYNLKLVRQPIVAARRIKQRLRELSWQFHPRLQEREKIFVGRNAKISEFEERIDNFDLVPPVCIIASGMKGIGRRSFLKHVFIKSNLIDESYRHPTINLTRYESIEDFILKIHDLGLSSKYDLANMIDKTVEEKVDIATNIIREIQKAREIILIVDDGCIVNQLDVVHWFRDIVNKISIDPLLTFAIASSYRPSNFHIKDVPTIYAIGIPELTVRERKGLFKRCCDFEGIDLNREDFSFFTDLLYGYPEQVLFAVDIIKDIGVRLTKKESHQIQEYNSEKASIILQKYQNNEEILDFIYLLSEFEFISLDFLFDIVLEDKYSNIIDELSGRAICDYIGIEQEFIRLNDTIRDYVSRNRFGIPTKFKDRLKNRLESFINEKDKLDRDVSDYIYSTKSAMMEGKEIDHRYLIPSHFLRTMRDLYQQRDAWDRVIELADIILQKESTLEDTIKKNILYYLCLSLARKRDSRFLREVQKIHGPEHQFLLGFYYRLTRRYNDALKQLQEALKSPITSVRAKRELVQVYLYLEEYDMAFALARENYEENRDNPYHIQSYFNCLINSENPKVHKELLERLISELKQVGSDEAREMESIANALYYAKCDDNYQNALNSINDTINTHDSPYPLLTKFDICFKFRDLNGMNETIRDLEKLAKRKIIYTEVITRAKCFYLACKGDVTTAMNLINNELRNYPDNSKEKLIKRISNLGVL